MPYADPEKQKQYYKERNARRLADPVFREKKNAYYRDYSKRFPERRRDAQLKCQFGITLAEFDSLRKAQHNRCAICNEVFVKTPHVDHDHNTGKVRGLLCLGCNTAVGNIKDSLYNAISLAEYLYVHKEV